MPWLHCLSFLRVNSLQVPFFATHETKRKRGYGRALVEAIEEVGPELPLTCGLSSCSLVTQNSTAYVMNELMRTCLLVALNAGGQGCMAVEEHKCCLAGG